MTNAKLRRPKRQSLLRLTRTLLATNAGFLRAQIPFQFLKPQKE